MCIRDRFHVEANVVGVSALDIGADDDAGNAGAKRAEDIDAVSYTHLRAHETVLDLVCRLLLEKKKHKSNRITLTHITTNKNIINYEKTTSKYV